MADFRDNQPEKIFPKDFKTVKVLKAPPQKKGSPACFLAGGGTKPLTADRYLMPYFARISTIGC